ncbi:uncharacterized protein [Chelonus insularis]|nr:uncharacterized protein LOC118066542 isoform X2 [Chelonus insularis]XP_034938537.1 uncharacterized protein LOC118066542 isoform X2 [Chelonus insularis]
MVNMEAWIPPQEDTQMFRNHYNVRECGSVTNPGRFGWFIPGDLSEPDDTWRIFAKQESANRFDVDTSTLLVIQNYTKDLETGQFYCQESFCHEGMYIPSQCQGLNQKLQPCALLLASESDVTYFVKDHIDILKLYVKVAWVGPHLKNLTRMLTKQYVLNYMNESNLFRRSLVILHWTPSDIIPNEKEFIAVDFPKCGTRGLKLDCVYESNRLVKLAWSRLESIAKFAWEAINKARFSPKMYDDLMDRYNRLIDKGKSEKQIACDWLQDNLNYTLNTWMPNNADKNELFVGGIFPMSGGISGKSIVIAARMAKEAINVNNSLLHDYNLTLLASDGQCKSDMVMKSFIDYIVHNYYKKLIGVLGPACSDTIEPLIGISRHYKTVVISYSAEGSTFNDRNRYPYFFRTIGENKQYRHVYLELFKIFGWQRVAALTEDGQKYTEYISYLQEMLRENEINFLGNFKFPREREIHEMTQYLADLKTKRARIIIADIYDKAAREVMCEAFKLEMTAEKGYVWFLPLWLQPNWYDTDIHNKNGESVPCTTADMIKSINGYFSVSHAFYADDNEIMQEGITVRQWRDRYETLCKTANQSPSLYAGYVYDAMWTYAYAVDHLIKENQSYVFDLHSDQTVNRLTDIIANTDFKGVSGNIKFYGGPSRLSKTTIVQTVNNESIIVGNFYPNISEKKGEIIGGKWILNQSKIIWLSGKIPDDGSEPQARCILAGLAESLDVSCEVAIVIANIIGLGFLGTFLITGLVIIKKKYDAKVRQHEKMIESFGLDPRHATFDLDKWEIPRDHVVINRKLGEGAFGMVYGGEAFFPEKGWLAVAVKALKLGSTTEQKLDFLSEVEVMKRFDHKNIIKLLGVCIKCAPVLTVMEFMLYGDLKTYLLARRHLVNDQSYEDSDEISNKKLTAMALDVARALSYLAQMKYVHRDVASRNCLVNAQRVVKLGDFGMTRPMYENDYYKFSRKGMLPVRWMAPESLSLGVFTPASDVWSYGVLLYEIITFGSFPFQGMSNNQVLNHVKEGNCLEIPKGLDPKLEQLLRSCWIIDYPKRPTAPEIVDFLAMNPCALSPCLDGPRSSVQLENGQELDVTLTKPSKKFSLSLGWSSSQRRLSSLPSITQPTTQLVDISTDEEVNNLDRLLEIPMNSSDIENSLPLLSTNRLSRVLEDDTITNGKDIPSYVNTQPGENLVPLANGNILLKQRDVTNDDNSEINSLI